MNSLRLAAGGFVPAAFVAAQVLWSPARAAEDNPDQAYLFEREVPRLALVIGNARYPRLGRELTNAYSDALGVADLLGRKLRFNRVTYLLDATHGEIARAISELQASQAAFYARTDVTPFVVVFFAGHGFTRSGAGFITGTDLDPDRERILRASYSIETMAHDLSKTANVILLLDTCRLDVASAPEPTLPEALRDEAEDSGQDARKEIENELEAGVGGRRSAEEADDSDEGQHLYFYAVLRSGAAGSAARLQSRWSPYTTGLLARLGGRPGEALMAELHQIVHDVRDATRGVQVPFPAGSVGEVYLNSDDASRTKMRERWIEAYAASTDPRKSVTRYRQTFTTSPYIGAATQWLRERN